MLSRGLQPVGARVPEEDACLFSHERRRVWAQEATLAKHDEAMRLSYAKRPGHLTREEKIARYQAQLEGERGSKYQHADYRPNGGTQIAGMATHTPSMTANWRDPAFHLNYTQTLNTGAPPIRGSMPPHRAFRVA